MKLRYTLFLAKANLRRNKHSSLITFLIVLLVISLSVISVLSVTLSSGMDEYKNDFRARTIEAYPYDRIFNEKTLEEISKINHVESIDIEDEMRQQFFGIKNISDENGTYNEMQNIIDEKGSLLNAWSLIGGEKRAVISGKSLDESAVFGCIIPHLFYPFDDKAVYETSGLNYIDAESLIGKTLTLTPSGGEFSIDYYDGIDARRIYLSAFEIKLKIVGVYYSSTTADGGPDMIYISEETGKKLIEMAVENAKKDYEELSELINRDEFRNLHITVDSFDNLGYVYDELNKLNITFYYDTELGINPDTPIITAFFNILSILLTSSALFISFSLLLYFSVCNVNNKREEIGIMKAVGYKDRQIFKTFSLEELLITLKGFIIGMVISALTVTVINLVFSNGSYAERIFIISPINYLLITAAALFIVIAAPVICEVLVFHKLAKIQPKDAMG